MCLWQISPSMACFLIVLTLPFREQRCLILIQSSFSTIFFMDCALALYLKRHFHTHGHLGFFLCYLLGIFSFVFYIFGFMTHFDFISVRVLGLCLDSCFACGCSAVPAPFVAKTVSAWLSCLCSFL